MFFKGERDHYKHAGSLTTKLKIKPNQTECQNSSVQRHMFFLYTIHYSTTIPVDFPLLRISNSYSYYLYLYISRTTLCVCVYALDAAALSSPFHFWSRLNIEEALGKNHLEFGG